MSSLWPTHIPSALGALAQICKMGHWEAKGFCELLGASSTFQLQWWDHFCSLNWLLWSERTELKLTIDPSHGRCSNWVLVIAICCQDVSPPVAEEDDNFPPVSGTSPATSVYFSFPLRHLATCRKIIKGKAAVELHWLLSGWTPPLLP